MMREQPLHTSKDPNRFRTRVSMSPMPKPRANTPQIPGSIVPFPSNYTTILERQIFATLIESLT
jgi:hypothetical protein